MWRESGKCYSCVNSEKRHVNMSDCNVCELRGISEELQETWLNIQDKLKKQLILEDTEPWQKNRQVYTVSDESDSDEISDGTNSEEDTTTSSKSESEEGNPVNQESELAVNDSEDKSCRDVEDSLLLRYVGGVDISYIKDNEEDACVAVVVISLPDLNLVYQHCELVKVTAPYVPGFLGFREAELTKEVVLHLKNTCPQYFPQVILVDGNGILHPRGFGFASHLGVILDIPCIGVAKNLYHTDGIERNEEYKQKISELKKAGDLFYLKGVEQGTLGAALKTHDSATKPVYVSQGHRCSLETAIWVVKLCSRWPTVVSTLKPNNNNQAQKLLASLGSSIIPVNMGEGKGWDVAMANTNIQDLI